MESEAAGNGSQLAKFEVRLHLLKHRTMLTIYSLILIMTASWSQDLQWSIVFLEGLFSLWQETTHTPVSDIVRITRFLSILFHMLRYLHNLHFFTPFTVQFHLQNIQLTRH